MCLLCDPIDEDGKGHVRLEERRYTSFHIVVYITIIL